jgi:hypothetical protein
MHIAELSWRIVILLLPWQTRWFRDASLAGTVWEQARLSFYISWLPLICATVLLLWGTPRVNWLKISWKECAVFGLLFLLSVVPVFRNWLAVGAVIQWWIQVLLLSLFVVAIFAAHIPQRPLATWVVYAVIPHIVLAYWQFVTQYVIGSSWLGMSAQDPLVRGVSVIAFGSVRLLRAYGGFPHPNILGGWIALACCLLVWLWSTSDRSRERWMWLGALAIFSGVLVLSFSRSAWLGAACGMATWILVAWKMRLKNSVNVSWWRNVIPLGVMLGATLMIVLWQWTAIRTRFDPTTRLEAKSIEERGGSLKHGFQLFRDHVLIGTGPNAERVFLMQQNHDALNTPLLEPPHNVFLLVLVHFGLLGASLFSILGYFVWQRFRGQQFEKIVIYPLLVTIVTLAMFDHYLWTLWAGQTLIAFTLLIVSLSFQDHSEIQI